MRTAESAPHAPARTVPVAPAVAPGPGALSRFGRARTDRLGTATERGRKARRTVAGGVLSDVYATGPIASAPGRAAGSCTDVPAVTAARCLRTVHNASGPVSPPGVTGSAELGPAMTGPTARRGVRLG